MSRLTAPQRRSATDPPRWMRARTAPARRPHAAPEPPDGPSHPPRMARPAPAAGEHALVGAVGAPITKRASTGSAGAMEGGRAMRLLLLIASLLLLVALAAQFIGRRRFSRARGGFRCKARLSEGRSVLWPRLRPRWTRRRLRAR